MARLQSPPLLFCDLPFSHIQETWIPQVATAMSLKPTAVDALSVELFGGTRRESAFLSPPIAP